MAESHGESSDVGVPGWVKVSALVAAVLALSLMALMVLGHGPGQHLATGVPATTGPEHQAGHGGRP